MKLSCKSFYAVRALFDIAYHGGSAPSKIDDIAQREQVSPRFLEQIFQDLKKAELIGSKRGPRGGYFLTQPPEEITFGKIIRAVEGETEDSFCREYDNLAEGETTVSMNITSPVWRELAQRIDDVLDSVTIQDLVERGEEIGVQREGYNGFVYVI
ncbi:MAG: Rrf2 family transcriptional regulator [Myxococcales bacterium]|nr:Rrf2 family transcriptional regulator [Myxococcales bacterium]